jgi:hypothetical protein
MSLPCSCIPMELEELIEKWRKEAKLLYSFSETESIFDRNEANIVWEKAKTYEECANKLEAIIL